MSGTSSADDRPSREPRPSAMRRSSSTISIDYEPILEEMIENEMEFAAPSFFDLLDSFGNIGPRVERIQSKLLERSRSVRAKVSKHRNAVVEPIQGKVNKEFDRVKARFTRQLDRAQQRWESPQAAKFREKIAFVLGVGNVFVTGYLLGGRPEWMHLAYTSQVFFLLPWRYYTYRKRGMHYFVADLCYWVNFLTMVFLWIAPWSAHLLAACYYLALGSLAWAIVAWRNSLVFHSVDKVTSLFIHVYPPAVMHTIVHLLPRSYTDERFPGVGRATELPFLTCIASASAFYLLWQILYYVLIQVRRQEKIKAGRPTSFTWLLKSYSKTWLGKLVLRLPEPLQPFAFMAIQFIYALITMAPCGIWLHSRLLSGLFMSSVFSWSIWNGANYYARISAARDTFKTELERLREELANMDSNSSSSPATPALQPRDAFITDLDLTSRNTELNGRLSASNSPLIHASLGKGVNVPPLSGSESHNAGLSDGDPNSPVSPRTAHFAGEDQPTSKRDTIGSPATQGPGVAHSEGGSSTARDDDLDGGGSRRR
ncbi:hypothetical protein PYCC9005_003855 [Savitreella phatthalungensis]